MHDFELVTFSNFAIYVVGLPVSVINNRLSSSLYFGCGSYLFCVPCLIFYYFSFSWLIPSIFINSSFKSCSVIDYYLNYYGSASEEKASERSVSQ
ncbi:hypothetical protein QE152_g37370 [Popillia japonica]|uniref:Uncharacterized protein n=1 Tax=Popillia japonica TaxID=7064 RepID=A0AAW1IAI6_POPJA